MRLSPLTPIFDYEHRKGAVRIGNTPGAQTILVLVGSVTDSTELNGPRGIAPYGSYVVAVSSGSTDDRLTVIDCSDTSSPAVVGSVGRAADSDFNNPRSVSVSGDYAFVSCGSGWVFVIDISTPASPVIAGKVQDSDFGAGANGVGTAGTLGFVAKTDRLGVVDFSTAATPVFVADDVNATAYGFSNQLATIGDYVFVPNPDDDRVSVVDISTPASPAVVGSQIDATVLSSVVTTRVFDATHILAVDQGGYISVIDISTPASPSITGTLDLSSWFFLGDAALTSVGSYVIAVGSNASGYPILALIDWTTLASPTVVSTYVDSSGSILDNPEHLCAFGSGVAVTDTVHDKVLLFEIQ